jgi:PPOX class probable F420-dependent enzyme
MSTAAEPGSPANARMGHGVKQRDIIKMSDEEVDAFLHERRPMSLCTINHDGSIHAVAMWYGFLEGAIAFETKAKSQKVQNLRRDKRLTVMVEDGTAYEELRGVELSGWGEVIDDRDELFKVGVSVFERYYGPYNDEMAPFVEQMLNKRVAVRLHTDRVVSWDHSKLGRPA